jgi:hypothetical protein
MKTDSISRKVRFSIAALQSPFNQLCDEWILVGRETGTGKGIILLSQGHPFTEADVRLSTGKTTGELSVWLQDHDEDGHRQVVTLRAGGRPEVVKPPV